MRKSKSEAGTGRRLPIAAPLKPILLGHTCFRGALSAGASSDASRSPPGASRPGGQGLEQALAAAKQRNQELKLDPIGLHECRHTYASFLMAAGYTLRELMEYMGHSSLQATERYVKLLPQPAGPDGAADRLNAYLAAWRGRDDRARCQHVANKCTLGAVCGPSLRSGRASAKREFACKH